MRVIQLKDLLDLTASEAADPEERIQKIYDWHYSHNMAVARVWIGVAVSIFVVVLAASLKKDAELGGPMLWAALPLALMTASYAFWILFKLRNVSRSYVSSLCLLAKMKALAPFLKQWKEGQAS